MISKGMRKLHEMGLAVSMRVGAYFCKKDKGIKSLEKTHRMISRSKGPVS